MSTSYFILEKGIIERQDLSIYEKMCCVVLAKWAIDDIEDFHMETLAIEMSCTLNKAKETIKQLKQKGFIQSVGPSEKEQVPKIIKAKDVQGLAPIAFDDEDSDEDQKLMSKEELLQEVRNIIDEPLNDSEAKIILNFAGDDLERIKLCYKKAKHMQVGDKVEALMMELQRREKAPAKLPPMTESIEDEAVLHEKVVLREEALVEDLPTTDGGEEAQEATEKSKRPWYLDDGEDEEDFEEEKIAVKNEASQLTSKSQINSNMIHKMKAYKNYGK